MNIKWLVIVVLGISCGSQPQPIGQSVSQSSDTTKVLATAIIDTPRHKSKIPWHDLTYVTDLNNDQIPDTITLTSSSGDAATFDTVSISITHYAMQTFTTSNPWTTVDKWFLDSNKNALQTDNFFLAKGKLQSVLLLFGNLDAAGYREDFSILNIEKNRAALVLNQNERHIYIETPISVEDIDGDGRLEFLYRQIFEYNGMPDTLDGKIGTFSPYFVYTIDSNCILNRPLTIQYNQEHYVFAGFEYDEGIAVFYPNDGSKPRLWKQ